MFENFRSLFVIAFVGLAAVYSVSNSYSVLVKLIFITTIQHAGPTSSVVATPNTIPPSLPRLGGVNTAGYDFSAVRGVHPETSESVNTATDAYPTRLLMAPSLAMVSIHL